MTNKKSATFETILLIIIIILIIILLIISFGKIDFSEKKLAPVKPAPQEDQGSKKKKLEEKLIERKKLKAGLEIKAIRYYFWSKAVLATIYLSVNIACGILFWVGNLSQTLNLLLIYNQVFFILYALFMLVVPQRPLNVTNIANAIKLKISGMLYSRYCWLDDEIAKLELELNTYSNLVPAIAKNN